MERLCEVTVAGFVIWPKPNDEIAIQETRDCLKSGV